MKKASLLLIAMAAMSVLSACSVSQKKTQAMSPQVVEFSESEVPYMQVVKKDGKLSAEIVDATGSKVTAK